MIEEDYTAAEAQDDGELQQLFRKLDGISLLHELC